jgi:tetratricopeptide (TPR) repeat protein
MGTRVVALLLAMTQLTAPLWATCGGGGGGGAGGMRGMSGASGGTEAPPEVYQVPWKMTKDGKALETDGLVFYWFPLTAGELRDSSLRTSRDLSLWSAQGVTTIVADFTMPVAAQLKAVPKNTQAILADGAGNVISRVEGQKGILKASAAEKLVRDELKKRETDVNKSLADAKAKAKAGDKPGAIELYQSVWAQRVLFPKKAKDAAKELKKLGVTVAADDTINALPETAPAFEGPVAAEVVATMDRGLRAEIAGDYELAKGLYLRARALDPADPAPARYLGELYRHHTGEWDKARAVFEQMLTERIDPLAEAVALHGLGKMTIHEGFFVKGLRLMERSIEAFPLALTYRNLAVFWNSECDPVKAAKYAELALSLDPQDPYNRVFAAVFMAANGRKDEALKIAQENDGLMAASYNLAAIYAQAGDKERALAYLQRHFYTYERYHEVRAKEMMEARVDAVFDSIRADAAFVKLTEFADGRLPLPAFPRQPMTFPKGT